MCHLGTFPYSEAVAIQEQFAPARQDGELPDTLLLLEHPPVYTRGRRSADEDLPLRRGLLPRRRHPTCRYRSWRQAHLPRARPARRLSDHGDRRCRAPPAHDGSLDRLCARRGRHPRPLASRGGPDFTGVWVAERKIASIGVHVSRGVSTHGFAVNVDNDLDALLRGRRLRPARRRMTSLAARARGTEQRTLHRFRTRMGHHFCLAHGRAASDWSAAARTQGPAPSCAPAARRCRA